MCWLKQVLASYFWFEVPPAGLRRRRLRQRNKQTKTKNSRLEARIEPMTSRCAWWTCYKITAEPNFFRSLGSCPVIFNPERAESREVCQISVRALQPTRGRTQCTNQSWRILTDSCVWVQKCSAPRVPTWSPTVVLAGLNFAKLTGKRFIYKWRTGMPK